MKRKLEKKERELTKKGLKKNRKDLTNLRESLTMLERHKGFRNQKREYEDLVRPYNRKKEDLETENLLKNIKQEISMKEKVVRELVNQLENGVEVKRPIGT